MFIDKVFSLIIGILFLIAISCDGPSATESVVQSERDAKDKNKPLLNDPVFWDYAASSNMLQIELGKLAAEKGSTANIKARGKETVNFHSKALQQLKDMVANVHKITLPDNLGSADQYLVEELRLLDGNEFNTRYHDYLLNSHQMQLERYKEALGRAETKETQAWLQTMLEHIQEELNTIAGSDSVVQQ